MIDDVVVGFEHAVREPICAHELPDVFLRIEFWRTRWQRHEGDIGRGSERLGAVPSGLVEDEDSVRAGRDFGRDIVEMELHGLGVAHRQDEA